MKAEAPVQATRVTTQAYSYGQQPSAQPYAVLGEVHAQQHYVVQQQQNQSVTTTTTNVIQTYAVDDGTVRGPRHDTG
jgi:hypothetical protein